MNLTIAKEQLLSGLQAVQNVVSTRTTLPVLSNVLIRGDGTRLDLTATDLDITVTSTVEAAVKQAGAATVPVKRLFDIVRELNHSELEIRVDEKNVCSLRCGSSAFRIRGLGAEEFPPPPQFKDGKRIVLPQEKMKVMLRRSAFAISTDEARYVLNGIFFSLKDHKVIMVATDGRRLAFVDEDVDVSGSNQGEFIIPAKTVNELIRLLQDKGEVEIEFNDNQAAFRLRNEKLLTTTITTKLVEGTYPNYRHVIPAETKERIALGREEFMHALRRAEIMTSDKQTSVKLAFTRNTLTITANTPDVGEAVETIAINYKGPDISVAFNPGYMIQPLGALDTDEVFLELIDELSPGVLKINGSFLYVVMPMRLT